MDFFNDGNDLCVVSKDLSRKITNCNKKFLDFYGKSKDDVIGKTINELRPDEKYGHLYKKFDIMLSLGKPCIAIHPGVDLEGNLTYYWGTGEIKSGLDGSILGYKVFFYGTGENNLFSLVPLIEFINGKYICDHANIGKSLFEGLFRTEESYVFFFLIRGWSMAAISNRLDISLTRVQELTEIVFLKMGVNNIDELYDIAARKDMLCNVPQDLLVKKHTKSISHNNSSKAHYWQYATKIQKIYKMLLCENDEISSFSYANFFEDNSAILLSTHPDQIEESIRNMLTGSYTIIDDLYKGRPYFNKKEFFAYIKTDVEKNSPKCLLMLCLHHGDWIEVSCFGAKNEVSARRLLENEQIRLVNFIHSFLGQAEPIIKEANSNKILLSPDTAIAKVSRKAINEQVISPREFDVLRLLSRSKPPKVISKILTISEHTVNFHIKSMKEKFNLATRNELTELYWSVMDN